MCLGQLDVSHLELFDNCIKDCQHRAYLAKFKEDWMMWIIKRIKTFALSGMNERRGKS
jgi:hypothetical protein